MRGSIISWFITAFIMAIAWQATESGAFQEYSATFWGKILISFIILIFSKFLAKLLGG